jgi:long-chain acyl-CoA synthetase
MGSDRFWTRNYDEGVTDIDPALFEIPLPEASRRPFEEFPEKVALAFMGVHITYAQLHRYANRFANMLLSLGLKKGSVVGINLPNIPEYVIAWLGTLRAGCVVMGVSPLLSADDLEAQLRDSKARAVVTLDALFEHKLSLVAPRLNDLEIVVATSVGAFLPGIKRFLGKALGKIPKGQVTAIEGKTVFLFMDVIKPGRFPDAEPDPGLTPDDIAYLQYTGGTTGVPKGAMLSHRNAVADLLIFQKWAGLERGRYVGLSGFPFFHIAGIFTNANFVYLGWTQVLIPNPRDSSHVCKEICRYRPYMMANVPSFYMILAENPRFREIDHSGLFTAISAAAPFPEEAQHEFEAIVGKGKIVEGYGMTETSPLTVFNPVKGKKKYGTIGLPLPNTDVRVVDPGTGVEVEPGQPGEMCIRGPQVMVGYFGRPGETANVIDREGWLHTGDVVVQDEDGYLRIVDRTKDMIIVGGFKVFSKKVEDILSRHPAVGMAAIVGTANPERPGSEIVKAFVTIKPGFRPGGPAEAVQRDILEWAKGRLAPYEMPKALEIRDELPLTTVGKVDKKALRREA